MTNCLNEHLQSISDNFSLQYSELRCEVRSSEYNSEKLSEIDCKYGYSIQKLHILDIMNTKNKKLWNKIIANPSHALHTLLPPKRKLQLRDRGHDYELPNIRTERFKRVFLNRCLFKLV